MFERIGVVLLVTLVVGLAFAFFLYIYIFGTLDGDVNDTSIERTGQILGLTTVNTVDSNFVMPEDITYETEDIFSDEITNRIESTDVAETTYNLTIPKFSKEVVVDHTNDISKLENNGWIVLPWSYVETERKPFSFLPWVSEPETNGPVIVCYRNYYGPTHTASCYDLDQITEGTEITFDGTAYAVESLIVRKKDESQLFESGKAGYLKLVTLSGASGEPEGDSNYLVIIAKQLEVEVSEEA